MKWFGTTLGAIGAAIYAGGSLFFAVFLHASYSTYMRQLDLAVGYVMELKDGIWLGLALGLSTSVAIWLTLSLFIEKEPSRKRALLRASISFTLVLVIFASVGIATIPRWYDIGSLYPVIIPGLAVSVSAYLNHRFRASHYSTNRGLERDHHKLLQALNSFGWLIAFFAATTILGFFYTFVLGQIPEQHRLDDPATMLVSLYAAAGIFLVGGMAVVILGPLLARLGEIERNLKD